MENENQSPAHSGSLCEHIRSLLPAYAEGDVSDTERGEIASHLALCADCRARCELFLSLPRALAAALPSPTPEMHTPIMQAVHRLPRRRFRPKMLSAAAAVICLSLIGIAILRVTPKSDGDMAFPDNDFWGNSSAADESDNITDPSAALEPSEGSMNAPPDDQENAESEDPSADASPSLTLPDEITLQFIRHADGYWICNEAESEAEDENTYILLFFEDGTFYLDRGDGRSAQGLHDENGNVELIGAHTYSGYFEQSSDTTLTLYLSRKS